MTTPVPRLSTKDALPGRLILNRHKPHRGLYEIIRLHKRGRFMDCKHVASGDVLMLRRKTHRLATEKEIADAMARRIQGMGWYEVNQSFAERVHE